MNLSNLTKVEARQRLRACGVPADRGYADARIAEALMGRVRGVSLGGRVLMAFLSLPDEPSLDEAIGVWLASGQRVCVPSPDWGAGSMEAAELKSLDLVVSGRYGVREPAAGSPVVPIEEVGLVVVPGLGFDASGVRLGRGGGFYDRFLSRLGARVRRIGVGYESRMVESLPRDAWDERVDEIVSEAGHRVLSPVREER